LVINNVEQIPFTAGTAVSALVNLTASQVVPLRVEFYDFGGNQQAVLSWKTPGASSYVTIPTTNFFLDSLATTAGVAATFWANTAFAGEPYYADYQTQINYSKGSSQPSDTWAVQTFSATWDGYLNPPSTGSNYLFTLLANTQARVYLNGTLILDGWTTPGSASTTAIQSAPISLTAGVRVPIHVDYANGSGAAFMNVQWQPPTQGVLSTIPNTYFYREANTSQQGLLATYYANTTQTAPYFYQVAENNNPELNYTFGQAPPGGNLAATNFTVRWTGQVLPQYTEPYYFTVKSDDGARLWVNGQLVLNFWRSQSLTENISPPINLQAGTFYDIQVEYIQLTGSAEAHLNWFSADQAEQIIPQSRLFPSLTGQVQAGPTGVTSTTTDTYVTGSGSPYTYTITGSNGASSYSATGLSAAGLTLVGNVISGTPAPGTYQFTVTTTNASGTSSTVVNLTVLSAVGNITREVWTGLAGPNTSDIPVLSQTPTTTDTTLTTIEDASAYANNNACAVTSPRRPPAITISGLPAAAPLRTRIIALPSCGSRMTTSR
jgi:hypothetical protein